MIYSQVSPYTNTASPRLYLLAVFPGVHFTLIAIQTEDGIGFAITAPHADWDLDPWSYYQQAYPEIGNAEQPSEAAVLAWSPPSPEQPAPLTDVEIATNNFRNARLAAPAALDSLKGTVWAGLVAGGLAPDEATAAGVGLVLLHGPLLAAFEAAGGHPVAGQALYAAIASQESVAALPWLTEGILAIFAAALAPG